MEIGYNQATTLEKSDVETDLKYCEKYGYKFIEFQMAQLNKYLEKQDAKKLKGMLDAKGIKTYSLNALEFFNLKKGEEFDEVKSRFIRMCKIAESLQCVTIIVVPSPNKTKLSNTQIKEDALEALNVLADIGQKYNIRLAFEFLGFKDTSVNSFTQCYDIINAVNRDNVGLVLDCFHFYAGGSNPEELREADPEKIFVFHINDSINLPLQKLQDSDRVWPGEGVIPLNKILGILKEIGFDGVATVELFNPEYWKWDPEKTIRIAKQKTEKVIKEYFG